MSVITEKGDITTSYLLIQRARSSDSGKYICLPSNANEQTINVHVLNGKYNDEVNWNVWEQFSATAFTNSVDSNDYAILFCR